MKISSKEGTVVLDYYPLKSWQSKIFPEKYLRVLSFKGDIQNKRIEEENMRIKEWEKKFDEEQRKKEDELIKKFYNQETDIQSQNDDNNDEGSKSN